MYIQRYFYVDKSLSILPIYLPGSRGPDEEPGAPLTTGSAPKSSPQSRLSKGRSTAKVSINAHIMVPYASCFEYYGSIFQFKRILWFHIPIAVDILVPHSNNYSYCGSVFLI